MKSALHVVCLLTPNNLFGGPVSVATDICTELQRRDVGIAIAGMTLGWTKPPGDYSGVPVISARAWRLWKGLGFVGMFSLPAFLRIARASRRYDVVHVHLGRDLFTSLTTLYLALRGHGRLFVQTHGMLLPKAGRIARLYDRTLILPSLRRAKGVFYLTEREAQELRGRFPGIDSKLVRLTNGVHTSAGGDVAPRAERTSVVFAARLHERKRPTSFVHAASQTLDSFGDDVPASLTFDIIGPDEGELAAVQRAIPEVYAHRIRYLGPYTREEVQGALINAIIFVLPSIDEPYPVTVLESLAKGTPVICTDSCGLARDLEQADAGVVVPGSDVELGEAVVSMLTDEAAWQRRSAHALRLAQQTFDIRSVADKLIGQYEA